VAGALFILGAIPFFAALFARVCLGERLRRTTLITMIVAACGLGVMLALFWGGCLSGFVYRMSIYASRHLAVAEVP